MQKKVFGIVHFLITRNGKFKKFLIKRINEKLIFEKFIKNNIITKAVSADNDRLASITYLNKNSKLLIKKFILIKKKIKAIYEK